MVNAIFVKLNPNNKFVFILVDKTYAFIIISTSIAAVCD